MGCRENLWSHNIPHSTSCLFPPYIQVILVSTYYIVGKDLKVLLDLLLIFKSAITFSLTQDG
jgi:hypothetical protein